MKIDLALSHFLSTLSHVLPCCTCSMFVKLDRNTCDTVLFLNSVFTCFGWSINSKYPANSELAWMHSDWQLKIAPRLPSGKIFQRKNCWTEWRSDSSKHKKVDKICFTLGVFEVSFYFTFLGSLSLATIYIVNITVHTTNHGYMYMQFVTYNCLLEWESLGRK